jgi:ABC-type uncharacterized transport system substrate-binding protein
MVMPDGFAWNGRIFGSLSRSPLPSPGPSGMISASLVCEIGRSQPRAGRARLSAAEYLRAVDDAPEIDAEDALPVLVRAEHLASWMPALFIRMSVPPALAEFFALWPDVLVAIAAVAVDAARAATNTTPIIAFDLETDPVAAGLASSLAHPGRNVSGVYFDFPDFSSKWIELLKEAIPAMKSILVVLDPASPSPQLKAIMAVAATLSVAVETMEVRTMRDLDDVFRTASVRRPDAVVILSSPLIGMNPDRIADLTVKYRLPTISPFTEFARAGGLIAYGVDLPNAIRQVGVMTGKVLNGTKPADLPIERPTKFELVVNARTAKSLGLSIPTSTLLRADEVIE